MTIINNLKEKKFPEYDALTEAQMRILRSLLEYMLLSKLEKTGTLDGEEITELIQNKFGLSISSGVVYSSLCLMELKGQINSEWINGRKTYSLTNQGKQTLDTLIEAKEELHSFARLVLDDC